MFSGCLNQQKYDFGKSKIGQKVGKWFVEMPLDSQAWQMPHLHTNFP
jgi:hypothetical protein